MVDRPPVHIPVLAREILDWLSPHSSGVYIDATLGLGGHSALILEQSGPSGKVIGFEWDEQAAGIAGDRLSGFGERFQLVSASYADLLFRCETLGIRAVDGILVDLGVSSLQLDTPERGFSFMVDAPLDMRMDNRRKITAEHLVNTLKKDELADIFYVYGEERQARRVAGFIVETREKERLTTTRQLADLVSRAIPAKYHPKKIHVATKVFQALRIAVNRELDNVVKLMTDARNLLVPGARICIISFHSLEDRIVKQALNTNAAYRVLTKKPVGPTALEVKRNFRARSAKLRVAEKMEDLPNSAG
jgi:16S rRNA (cytosine1402-N4)-methyltransferase